ncbi:MAG: M24 family metallopeptidase [Acidimicrobiia bacterium]|nr:M24 family metallopeptidase [Acidimicrobiia bacterium]
MAARDVALAVLTNPVSLRYVADWREYQTFQSHLQTYTLFVPIDGPLMLYGAYATVHPVVDEFGPTHGLNVFDGGVADADLAERARRFAHDVRRRVAGGTMRVAVEAMSPSAVQALERAGLIVVDAAPLVEQAKYVKSTGELVCIRHSIAVAEAALDVMRAAARPGVTENEVFAVLHQTNIANDGDWIEGRMLCSGPRTNPWYQEASARRMETGDLLAVDTDMVGPFGYGADISRTWPIPADGPFQGSPTPQLGRGNPRTVDRSESSMAMVKDRYQRAHAEITHNAQLLGPGRTFRELSDKAFRQPDEFVANRYACIAHGVGMTDEYPRIAYRQDWEQLGYDGELVPGAVISVESFVGSEHGGPGVKLEDMYLITTTGAERLSSYPFEEDLLS